MRVEWLNCRLTFNGETPEEETALSAVWVAFGSQIDDRPGVDDDGSFESGEFTDAIPTQVIAIAQSGD